jgi:hypothetical protein
MPSATPASSTKSLLAICSARIPTKVRCKHNTKKNKNADLLKNLVNAQAGLSHHFLQPA